MSFYERVYAAVKKIPRGKVASYGLLAAAAGNPRASRVVGTALHRNPSPGEIPCHRVVNRNGRLADCFAFGGVQMQLLLLEGEGVAIGADLAVDMKRYCVSLDELL